jgi:hypothetical protein
MASHLGQYVKRQREQLGIKRSDLARAIGYKNIGKGCNRIMALEGEGACTEDFWRKVKDALHLDDQGVQAANHQDWLAYQAWLDEPVPMASENNRMTKQLAALLDNAFASSYVEVQGGFTENPGTDHERDIPGERSYFLVGITRPEAERLRDVLCKAPYNQDSILWGSKDEGAYWLKNNGQPDEYLGSALHIGEVGKYWTRIRNKQFEIGAEGVPFKAHECLRFLPCNTLSAHAWDTTLARLWEQQTADAVVDKMLDDGVKALTGPKENSVSIEELLTADEITEATVSRLLNYVKGDGGFAILSTDRNFIDTGSGERERRGRRHNRDVRSVMVTILDHLGLSYVKVRGGFPETTKDKQEVQVEEYSFFFHDISKDRAWRLARIVFDQDRAWKDWPEFVGNPDIRDPGFRFNQQSIIWGRRIGSDRAEMVFLNKDGTEYRKPDAQWAVGDIKRYWTRLRGIQQDYIATGDGMWGLHARYERAQSGRHADGRAKRPSGVRHSHPDGPAWTTLRQAGEQ